MNTRFILFLLLLTSLVACAEKQPQKPNVLMICVDDLNDWLGATGGHPNAITPNMDKLASQGMLFTNAHCQAPICGPSRASIMTGLRPSTTGIYGQINDQDIRLASPITSDITFLPNYFGQNGYHTMGIGKIFHGHAPEGTFDESGGRVKGFGPKPPKSFHWDKKGTSTDWGAFPERDEEMPDYQSAKWAADRLNRKYDKPFFLTVGFLRPHVPWHVPQKWFDMHPIEGIVTPPYNKNDFDDIPEISQKIHTMPMMPTTDWAIESGEWKNIVQAYLACVTFVDYYIGEVLTALENSEYAENTIVILWSDHGYRLGEKGSFAKHALWNEATNAPMIIKAPGIKSGQVSASPVELLDIYPTLLDLCSLPANERNEGKSLKPLLQNTGYGQENYAITTYGKNNHAVVTEGFRYIQFYEGSEELYDHSNDPNEWNNLAGKDINENKQKFKHLLPKTNAEASPKMKSMPNSQQ